jgi:ribosome-binding protein aMBF1 (putative translation factor)
VILRKNGETRPNGLARDQMVTYSQVMDTTPITRAIAERVNKAKERAGITTVELSDASGIARTTLSRKLKGQKEFDTSELMWLGKALGVNWLDFIPSDSITTTAA